MSYKIKVKEDDFIVKEKYSIDISDRGKYSVFLLYKRGWNTDELVKKISNDTGIDVNLFSYGGRKDRHLVSEQIITIRGNYKNLNYKSDFCNMRFLGFSNQPMSPKLIISNCFAINVRDINLNKKSDIQNRIEEIKDKGFVNYFDAQRFRSYDEELKAIYENLLIKRGVKRSMFNLRKIRKAYFKSNQRSVIEFPKNLSFSFEDDELYNSKLKLIISFELPAGSYATMLIKQLFI